MAQKPRISPVIFNNTITIHKSYNNSKSDSKFYFQELIIFMLKTYKIKTRSVIKIIPLKQR